MENFSSASRTIMRERSSVFQRPGRGSRIYSPRSIAVYYSSIGGGSFMTAQPAAVLNDPRIPSVCTHRWVAYQLRINGPLLFYRGGKCRSVSNEPKPLAHGSLPRMRAVTTHCCAKLSPRLFPRHRNGLATMRHL